eukprot:g16622.t1
MQSLAPASACLWAFPLFFESMQRADARATPREQLQQSFQGIQQGDGNNPPTQQNQPQRMLAGCLNLECQKFDDKTRSDWMKLMEAHRQAVSLANRFALLEENRADQKCGVERFWIFDRESPRWCWAKWGSPTPQRKRRRTNLRAGEQRGARPMGWPTRHRWRRTKVPLPSEQILNDVQQLEQLQRSAREQVKGREREVDPEGLEILRPRSGKTAVAKFLTNACLPRNYAVQWQKQSTRPRSHAYAGRVSLLALRHAQRALELLKDERPPEKTPSESLQCIGSKPQVAAKEQEALEDRPASRWAETPETPDLSARTLSPRPTTRDSIARSARVEALVSSRVLASERCAESARQWQESCYKKDLESEEEERRFPHGQSVMQKGFHALMEFLDFTNRRYGNPARSRARAALRWASWASCRLRGVCFVWELWGVPGWTEDECARCVCVCGVSRRNAHMKGIRKWGWELLR